MITNGLGNLLLRGESRTQPDLALRTVDDSDEALMSRVMRADPTAISPLVDRYYGPLLTYAFHMCGGDQMFAEDVVQETFLKILSQKTYVGGRPVRPWLYRVETNVAYDQIRRHRHVEDSEGLDREDLSPGVEAQALTDERAAMVRSAVSQMPWEYRSVLVLRYYQDLSLNEIADALAIPLGTVKSRLHEAIGRLRTGHLMTDVTS